MGTAIIPRARRVSWSELDLVARLSDALEVQRDPVLLFASRHAARRHPQLRLHLDRGARELLPQAREAHVLEDPQFALSRATAHLCLSRLGHRDAEFDARLAARAVIEPTLEHRWLLHVWNVFPTPPPRVSLRHGALAGHSGSLPLELIRATDFGATLPRLPRPRHAIAADVERRLAVALHHGDHATAAELLLLWPLLRMRWSRAAAVAFQMLDRAPSVPSGLLCAAALAPGAAPPLRPGARRPYLRSAVEELLELTAGSPVAAYVSQMDVADQDSAAELLLHVAEVTCQKPQRFTQIYAQIR